MRTGIRFLLGQDARELSGVDPARTVLQYLREDEALCGTKEGCAEGDCGACTVVLAERDGAGGIRYRAVNSCIMFLPALDGRQLLTVEHLRDGATLHPVQRAMVTHHASQCGFCTPGFVMSLAALHLAGGAPDRDDIADALAGNLCRCTGYRPILDAACAALGEERTAEADGAGLLQARLAALATDDDTLEVAGAGRRHVAPRSLGELTTLLAQEPAALILGGGTDVGLWVTKQRRDLPLTVATEHVAELRRIAETATHLAIGGAVTYADAEASLARLHPDIGGVVRRIGGRQIRERGTIGGNVANASPIGDMPPLLLALDAELVLASAEGTRRLPIAAFFRSYRVTGLRAGEVLAAIEIPRPGPGTLFGAYKVSKRFDEDISAVCAAFAVTVAEGRVQSARLAYGGMAETPARARAAEAALTGAAWSADGIEAALDAIDADFAPISDMRASAAYRRLVARNLLRKFHLEHAGGTPGRPRLRLDLPERLRA